MTFIGKVARFIKDKGFQLETLHVIVPSDRAIKQIKLELSKVYSAPIYSPNISTIDRWMRPDDQILIDQTRQLITLYNTCSKITHFENQTFEDFLGWANMLLQDFDEIDRYMLDAHSVFKNLKSIKELESWQLDDEELSASQLKFKDFWQQIPEIYTTFQSELRSQNKMTSGWAYREFATHIDSYLSKGDDHNYIFAGFNALSISELTAIKKLIEAKKAHFLTDSDVFYTSDSIHEAGTFIRKNHNYLGVGYEIPQINEIGEKQIDVQIIECTQQIGQVKIAANELHKLSEQEQNSTLILLCDESLITSITKNIPENIKKTNITLGLPITQTAIKSWVDILFQIQENKMKFNTESIYFYDFQRLINHSLTIGCLTMKEVYILGEIEHDSIKKNRIFHSKDTVKKTPLISEFIDLVYENWAGDWQKAIHNIRALNSVIIKNISQQNPFERSLMEVFDESLIEFQNIIQEGIPKMSQKSFKLFFDQHWIRKNISFKGDQRDGIQVMGLLETRMLDFKHIIAIGMNEGNLPATNAINSFIPMDLRAALGLPTTREKQGVFAHHFYRLLHQCNTLTATYCTNNEQLGPQEKSRYLLQLELELKRLNKNIRIKKKYYNIPLQHASRSNSQVIEKSELIVGRIENYFNNSISASSLNTYLRCPLDFYYKYIAELGEEKTIEEDIESQQFGSLIHNTLELLYEKHALFDKFGNENLPKRTALQTEDVEKMLVKYKDILHQQFMTYFDDEAQLFLEGKNVLSYTIAQDTIENMLKKELAFLKMQTEPVFIVQIESKKSISMELNVQEKKRTIIFSGYIDRIDRIGNKYRVIDYKSGRVKDKNVVFKLNKNGIITSFSECKHAVQLALYSLFFKESFGNLPDEALIFSLTDVVKMEYPLEYKGHHLEDICQLFREFLEEVLNEVFEKEHPIEHSEDAKYCTYCL